MKVSDITVDYVNNMGTDLDVVNAARVSFNKKSDWEWMGDCPVLNMKDERLIKYLAEHNHWSPFAHVTLSVRVKAPIFIARQLQKHTVGLAWNEVSRRYVDYTPELYVPDEWRERADDKKQGSGGAHPISDDLSAHIKGLCENMVNAYEAMIEAKVAPEQARMVLPQNTMTEWVWSGSLYAFARVINLRLGEGAQKEAGIVAEQLLEICDSLYPVSMKYLVKRDDNVRFKAVA